MTEARLLLLILPSLIVCTYLVWRAVEVRPAVFRLSDYFLAGGRLGPTMTRANALGSSMALANGLWLFVVLGYFDGAFAITAQLMWCLSIFMVGYLVPTVIDAAREGQTLHGFLGASFGSQTLRRVCGFVTGTGYLLNFGFETYVSGIILASLVSGTPELKWVFSLVLALSAALYISMSGFLGNVSQDRKQNAIGIGAVVAVLLLVLWGIASGGREGAPTSLVSPINWAKYLGIFVYASLFNLVDVSNWQTVAASKYAATPVEMPALRRAWTQTALLALVFPGLVGVSLGILLRPTTGLADTALFGQLGSLAVFNLGPWAREIVLGLLAMGFFVLALGYAENLLSAAQLTFMADVFKQREYDNLASPTSACTVEDEDAFVHACRRWTFVLAVGALLLFLGALRLLGESRVFGLMFIIFGSALSMLPCLLLATRHHRRGQKPTDRASRIGAFASVGVGYTLALSPLVIPAIVELSPVYTILASSVALVAARALAVRWTRHGKGAE